MTCGHEPMIDFTVPSSGPAVELTYMAIAAQACSLLDRFQVDSLRMIESSVPKREGGLRKMLVSPSGGRAMADLTIDSEFDLIVAGLLVRMARYAAFPEDLPIFRCIHVDCGSQELGDDALRVGVEELGVGPCMRIPFKPDSARSLPYRSLRHRRRMAIIAAIEG
jgi:hypothetical protein